MQETIWQTIAATPWWMFLTFVYLVWVCYQAAKPRLVTIKQLAAIAFAFFCLSAFNLCAIMQAVTYTHLSIWTGMLFLGTGLGYLQFSFIASKRSKPLIRSLCLALLCH